MTAFSFHMDFLLPSSTKHQNKNRDWPERLQVTIKERQAWIPPLISLFYTGLSRKHSKMSGNRIVKPPLRWDQLSDRGETGASSTHAGVIGGASAVGSGTSTSSGYGSRPNMRAWK